MSFSVGVDIGGTFTDTVVVDAKGKISTYKSPTTPHALLEGLLNNLHEAAAAEQLDLDEFVDQIDRFSHGTTAATNAFIERRGAKVALLTTRGFEDTIFMQRQLGMTAGLSPTELTDYAKRSIPEPLCPRSLVFGIRERIDAAGTIVCPLADDDIRAACNQIRASGAEAVAICFLWSFKNATHERRAAAIVAEELPEAYVSLSSELVPRLGEYERTATTTVNSYLGPVISRYMTALEERLRGSNLLLLDSTGSMMTPTEAAKAPVRLLLSGPSGGVTASRYLGGALKHPKVITFDMGGTSTDVGLIVDGAPIERHETVAGKYHLLLPLVDIRAIGAGGGSIASVEKGSYLRVGPESAGADPGPACYRRGGEQPTVTDADLVLGIIDPAYFLGGRIQLDVDAARRAVDVHVAQPLGITIEEAAAGIKRVVDERMGDLLRTATIEQGHDPRDFVLYAFGGAGATHAPAFALDIVDQIVVPPTQSVHSAFGAVASDIALSLEHSLPMRLARSAAGEDVDLERVEAIFSDLETQAHERLAAQDVPSNRRVLERLVEMRFTRQSKTLPVAYEASGPDLVREFLRLYTLRYGQNAIPETAGFELVTFIVKARGQLERPELEIYEPETADSLVAPRDARRAYDPLLSEFLDMPVFRGTELRPGNRIGGPAIIEYPGTTVAMLSGQRALVDQFLGISIQQAS